MTRFQRYFQKHPLSPCVKRLMSLPYTEQKSLEWLSEREKYITASEIANCFNLTEEVIKPYVDEFRLWETFFPNPSKSAGKDGREKYIEKKGGLSDTFTGNQATRFGQRYENIALRIYQQLKGWDVFEFGLVPHATCTFLGASPDGCGVIGTLVEIKCPSTRTPTGIPPFDYWCQMQSQMECCDADACDFFDASFVEYIDTKSWKEKALLWEKENPGARHHVFGMYHLSDGDVATFAPVSVSRVSDFEKWFDKEKQSAGVFENIRPAYYHLHEYFVTPVKRNRKWFADRMGDISAVWREILKRRALPKQSQRETKLQKSVPSPKKRLTEDNIRHFKCLV